MSDAILPGIRAALVDPGGTTSRPFYLFFQNQATNLAGLTQRVSDLESTGNGSSPISPNANVIGASSVVTQGTLKSGIVRVMLDNDVAQTEAMTFYGSLVQYVRGWHSFSANFAANDADELDLAEIPDAGGGELQKTAFDAWGRKTGTSAATTDNLTEGATNLYFTDARVYFAAKAALVEGENITITADDDALTLTIAATGGGGTGDVVGPSSATDGAVALFDGTTGKLLKDGVVLGTAAEADVGDFATAAQGSAADTALQEIVEGDNVTVDTTDPLRPVVSAAGSPSATVQASEGLAAGNFVRIYDAGGPLVRRADRSTADGEGRADGYVKANVVTGDGAIIFFSGTNDHLSGLTPGVSYGLDTDGAIAPLADIAAVSGEILQVLGVAVSSSSLAVTIDSPILRG